MLHTCKTCTPFIVRINNSFTPSPVTSTCFILNMGAGNFLISNKTHPCFSSNLYDMISLKEINLNFILL